MTSIRPSVHFCICVSINTSTCLSVDPSAHPSLRARATQFRVADGRSTSPSRRMWTVAATCWVQASARQLARNSEWARAVQSTDRPSGRTSAPTLSGASSAAVSAVELSEHVRAAYLPVGKRIAGCINVNDASGQVMIVYGARAMFRDAAPYRRRRRSSRWAISGPGGRRWRGPWRRRSRARQSCRRKLRR